MEWIPHLITLIGGGGVYGAVASIYKARKSAKVGQASNEVDATSAHSADWSSFTNNILANMERQDQKIASLETRMAKMQAEQLLDAQWIQILQEWIWTGKAPPPPPRPKPRDQ